VNCVEVILYAVDVRAAGVINYQNVIHIGKYPANLCLFERCVRWVSSRFCRKNSAIRPEIGVPNLLNKNFVFVREIIMFFNLIVPV
jgi:hypothetical protein